MHMEFSLRKKQHTNYYELDKRSKPFIESDSTAGKFMLHSVSERFDQVKKLQAQKVKGSQYSVP